MITLIYGIWKERRRNELMYNMEIDLQSYSRQQTQDYQGGKEGQG